MKHLIRVTFCVALFTLMAGAQPTFASISLSGQGGIDFEGTGTITHMEFPKSVREVYNTNCVPSEDGFFIVRCKDPLDTSLLGNDIVRAEHVRVQLSFSTGFFTLRFGCLTCGSPIVVGPEDLLFASGALQLSPPKVLALQSLIDQHGANSVHIALSISGGPITISSSVRAVGLDIKPGSSQNSFNPRSRGMIAVAILTTQFFAASSVDVDSLRFGATGAEATPHHAVLEDVDGDGDNDLLVFFRGQDADIDCDTLFTYISGETLTGQAIAGTDSVAVVGCH